MQVSMGALRSQKVEAECSGTGVTGCCELLVVGAGN